MSIATPIPQTLGSFAFPIEAVRRFSVAEYQRLTEIGILTEDDPVELLEGLIVYKMPKKPRHDATIDMLSEILWRVLPPGWFPRTQNTLITADSAPEPDVVVARGRPRDYIHRHPTAQDVALVIEVAESSIDRDWEKCRIYAHAGVTCYWIVDLNANRLEIFNEPDVAAGRFRLHVAAASEAHVSLPIPETATITLDLKELLSPQAE
jgi:Uma2 family endonuclease